MLHRRAFLQGACAGLLATSGATRMAFATTPGDKRFVFIFLRGGLDGLHALAPFGDPRYGQLRPRLALGASEVISLDGYFGLNEALAGLLPLYQAGELSFVPAASTRYRNRSHFDGQNVLENGSGRPFGARDGWLSRAIIGLNGGDRRLGLALGPTVPLILQGEAEIQTYANSPLPEVDDDFLARLGALYRTDALFARAFNDAQDVPDPEMTGMTNQPLANQDFAVSARVAAEFLTRPTGPRIAAMEMLGWDTHAGQRGRLNRLLGGLTQGILDLRSGLGRDWANTVVVVASEFGRTAGENGNQGTDHGTGGLAMIAGGAVTGGRIAGDWPGLSASALFEGRDVAARNDCESLFKAVLIDHLGLDAGYVEQVVFPDSLASEPMSGLIRL
ncbi:DUF1501 domain-containing protein [Pararhodobacter sp.]|uniref:DUF1501 domain-containing protein n=1 Tax=Pararhodobacter sp. TaxID=2127056 RepID=UPI002AFECD0B|nr:DUF1501 domain-containing protein [Pararhodobacter sp.]